MYKLPLRNTLNVSHTTKRRDICLNIRDKQLRSEKRESSDEIMRSDITEVRLRVHTVQIVE